MKLLTIVAIVLCAPGTSSFSASSLRIEAEIRRSMMGLDAAFSMEANNITECIQNRSESYFQSYEVLRDDVTVMLESLGPRGKLFSHILEKDANDIIESLKKKFNSGLLQSRVVGGIRAVQKKFSDDLLKEVRILQAAVDVNENAITCWDINKETLRNIFMSVFVQGREATYVNLAHLDARIEKVVKKIDDAIARIGKQLLEVCGYKSQCILSYVSLYLLSILS